MGSSNTNTASETTITATTEIKASDLRKKYGVHKKPLEVSAGAIAYRKVMNFDEQFKTGPNKQTTYSWVVMDPALADGRGLLVRANTYNGGLGERVDYLNPASVRAIPGFAKDDATGQPILDDKGQPVPTKERKAALKGYEVISLSEVPFITVKAAPVIPPAEITPPAESAPSEEAPPEVPAGN